MKPRFLPKTIISLADGEEAAHIAIVDLCNTALGWGVSLGNVEFTKISGGISNILVKVTPKLSQPQPEAEPAKPLGRLWSCWRPFRRSAASRQLEPVCVKVFGEKTELLIDRGAEAKAVVALGANGFGPEVIALFGNGRIEQFLHCMTLTPEQMCDAAFIPRIAALLARFHKVEVDLPRGASTFTTIRRWLAMARALKFEASDPKAAAYSALDFDAMEEEVSEVEAACALANSPVVWCHCDLLSGNILVLQRPGFDPAAPDHEGPLTVIDFEYGAYACRGFDFGNHFNEYAGFECEYSRYPDRQKQELFFRHYMGGAASAAGLAECQLDELCAEADVFALASHIYWGVWAIVQARWSPIDFDYMGYHHLRFGELRRRKEEFLTQARRVFGSRGGDPSNGVGAAAL